MKSIAYDFNGSKILYDHHTVARFESYFEKLEGNCWNWIGRRDKDGYGYIRIYGRTAYVRAHRFSWIIYRGLIPNGLCVCHNCDNPCCVNPAHLFIGTHQQNRDDCVKKGRTARGNKNGSITHPEKRCRGDRHWSRIYPEKVIRGERHHKSKLLECHIVEIRNLYESKNYSARSLGKIYGVSGRAILNIITRKSWK